MNETFQYQLIDGVFEPKDAGKILFSMISNKINYHTIEIFSIKERNIGDYSFSAKRVEELKQMDQALRDLIVQATAEKKKLQVSARIDIQLI